MEASDIAKVTYELIRIHGDRLVMIWEDDRGQLLREISKLKMESRRVSRLERKYKRVHDDLRDQVSSMRQELLSLPASGLKSRGDMDISKSETTLNKESINEVPMVPSIKFGKELLLTVPIPQNHTKTFYGKSIDAALENDEVDLDHQLNSRPPFVFDKKRKNFQRSNGSHIQTVIQPMGNIQNSFGKTYNNAICQAVPQSADKGPNEVDKPVSLPVPHATGELFRLDKHPAVATTKVSSKASRRNTLATLPVGSGLSTTSVTTSSRGAGKGVVKCVEVVRDKQLRAVLPGHVCEQCAGLFSELHRQGLVSDETLPDLLEKCSRHKSRWSPPHTPDGFWDLTVPSPVQWAGD